MDAVEEVFYSVLSGTAAITGLVSTRIYPKILPEDQVYPAIVFTRTGTEDYTCIGGKILKIGKATINVVVLSTSIAMEGTIERAVRDTLINIHGLYGNVEVKQVDHESGPASSYDPVLDVQITTLDFSVLYEDQ
jgi:hypothetical protein